MSRPVLYPLGTILVVCLPLLLVSGVGRSPAAPLTPEREWMSAAEAVPLSDEDEAGSSQLTDAESTSACSLMSLIPHLKSWEIVVLGPGDVPIEGVMIWQERTIYPPKTGPDGRGRVETCKSDRTVEIRLDDRVPRTYLTLTEPHTVVRFPVLPSLTISVVNAETGELLPDSVVRADGASVPLERRYGRSVMRFAPWRPGTSESIEIEVDPPPGFVMESPDDTQVGGHIATFTRAIEATVPAWPEADLSILVTEEDGRPVAGAVVDKIWFKGGTHSTRTFTTNRSGVVRMTGIPSIPGEPIRVFAGKDGRHEVSGQFVLGTSREEIWTTIVLPPEPKDSWCYRGPSGYVSGCPRQTDYRKPVGSGALLVVARRVCGRPATAARVELLGPEDERPRWRSTGATDAAGAILFEHLPAGPAFVHIREYGFIMPKALEVTVHAGTTTRVTVSEGEGEPVSVLVLTEQGVPVAGAELQFYPTGSGADLWLEGPVQRIGFFTDAQGRFTLPRAPGGGVSVYARLGSRKVSGKAQAGGALVLRFGE